MESIKTKIEITELFKTKMETPYGPKNVTYLYVTYKVLLNSVSYMISSN